MITRTEGAMDEVAQSARVIAGRYELGPLIGRGGMSDVHLATDAKLGRRVAVKLLKSSLASDPVFRTRFRHEAQAAARMAHPTIVRVFDAGEEIVRDGSAETVVPFIVMEHVEGRLLRELIDEGPMPVAEAVRIADGILTALEYSHRAGVVHRDIKPGNVMVTPTGQVKVMDFGIARAISDSAATVAQTSSILGTAQYFSPEQARGETVDARTDLYATGVVLFEMLTGRPLFQAESAVAVAYQHVSEVPAAPSSFAPQVPVAIDAVVLHALTKDRFARFQTASEFRADLTAAAAGQALPVRPEVGSDFTSTLFGIDPAATASTEAAMRQLSVDDDEERRSRTQSRPPVAWIWAGILIMTAVVAAVLFWAFTLERTPLVGSVAVEVPDVIGLPYEEGSQILLDAELQPNPSSVTDASVPEGRIISTDPPAGITVAPGQVIQVVVSAGPPRIQVPSITLLTLADAQAALEARGLVLGTVSAENSSSIPKDVVIRSDPEAGAELREGDTVNVVVSTGLVRVPDVRTLSVGGASSQLTALGLVVSVQGDSDCTGQAVTAQSLAPGDQPQGSAVTLRYCSGNPGGDE